MKDDLFQKKYKEIWYFLQAHQKEGLFKRGCAGTWSFLYYLKRWYIFSWKHDISSWAESQRWLFSRNTWKYDIFCVHVWVLQAWSHAPLPKKKSRMVLSRKNTPKGNWCSRLTSWKELQQFSVPSQRPLRAFSCIALQRKKPGNLIYRIEVWLHLQFIWLEIFCNE